LLERTRRLALSSISCILGGAPLSVTFGEMKLAAAIFFGLSLVALLLVAGCRWGFPPISASGPEGGLIVGALAHAAGLLTSLLATLFASIAVRRTRGAQGSGILLGGSALLLLSFVVILVV
jgi:hypothetical protein